MHSNFVPVRRTDKEPLFNALIEAHHYLGYTQPVGKHLKYVVYAGNRPVTPFARPNRSLKEVLGYPLTPRFRELLCEVR